MISAYRIVTVFSLIMTLNVTAWCGSGGDDNWFGRDKFEHFTISAFYAGGTTIIANRHFGLERTGSVEIGIGFSFSLGTAKEIIDSKNSAATSSFRDLIWDIAGALAGAIIAGSAL